MKIGIYSDDNSHVRGYYSKIAGLEKAAKSLGYNYKRINTGEGKDCDVVINWEPFGIIETGTQLTIAWVWDTHRLGLRPQIERQDRKPDIVFRAHATFYHEEDLYPMRYPTYWMPPAVDEEVFTRNNYSEKKYDIAWVGLARPFPEMKVFRDNFDVYYTFGGNDSYQSYIRKLSQGKLVLNAPLSHETNKRVMEAISIGPALMSWGPDYSLLFTPDKDFVCYDGKGRHETDDQFEERLICKVAAYLADPLLLEEIQRRGHDRIKNNFTFKHQVLRIERILKEHL